MKVKGEMKGKGPPLKKASAPAVSPGAPLRPPPPVDAAEAQPRAPTIPQPKVPSAPPPATPKVVLKAGPPRAPQAPQGKPWNLWKASNYQKLQRMPWNKSKQGKGENRTGGVGDAVFRS